MVQQRLGHARIDTTTISTKLTDRERRSCADLVDRRLCHAERLARWRAVARLRPET